MFEVWPVSPWDAYVPGASDDRIPGRVNGILDSETRIPGGTTAPPRVRELVSDQFRDGLTESCLQDLLLLTSELVTNSVLHAGVGPDGEIGVLVSVSQEVIRVAVSDPGSPQTPHIVEPDPTEPGGMGLFMVERLSDRWGVERRGTEGTTVWFEIERSVEP
jgi:anti-sigma regulatory factor (Ser/Thr protein kinase)